MAKRPSESAITWIHLSDYHAGQRAGGVVWPQVEVEFERSVRAMAKRLGPPDLLLFTGDLAFMGAKAEYIKVDRLLDLVNEWVGADLPVFAVPGNHDLARPQPGYTFQWLKSYEGNEHIRKDILEGDRRPLHPLFEEYSAWLDRRVIKSLKDAGCDVHVSEHMPGDVSSVFEKNGIKLGLMGLNSSWVQYDGGEFEGLLQLPLEQFHAALPPSASGNPLDWFKRSDASLLLTHHPPSWLTQSARKTFEEAIYRSKDSFALSLYGHAHEAQSEVVARSSTSARAYYQAPSLFGLEHYGTAKQTRICGYTWGRLYESGAIRMWPLKGTPRADRSYEFDRDTSFSPDDADDLGGFELVPARGRKPKAAVARGRQPNADPLATKRALTPTLDDGEVKTYANPSVEMQKTPPTLGPISQVMEPTPQRTSEPTALEAPHQDRLTLNWLWTHVPVTWWWGLVIAFCSVFAAGVKLGQLEFFREVFGNNERNKDKPATEEIATTNQVGGVSNEDLPPEKHHRLIRPEDNGLALSKLPADVYGFASVYGIWDGNPTLSSESYGGYRVLAGEGDDFTIIAYISDRDSISLNRQKEGAMLHPFVGYSAPFADATVRAEFRRSQLARGTSSHGRSIKTDEGDRIEAWDIVASVRPSRHLRVTLKSLGKPAVPKLTRVGIVVAWEDGGNALMLSRPRWYNVEQRVDGSVVFATPVVLLQKPEQWCIGDSDYQMHVWVFAGEGTEIADAAWDRIGQRPAAVDIQGVSWYKLIVEENAFTLLDEALSEDNRFTEAASFTWPLRCNSSLGEYEYSEIFYFGGAPVLTETRY